MQMPVEGDLLAPGPIREFRLDVTTRCNLRCVYCAVSQPSYVGADMPADIMRRALQSIVEISKHNQLVCVSVNGHGETTFAPGWERICLALHDYGVPLGLTTNLAREYSREEIETLSKIDTIAVSIDTHDRALLRRMRRRVDVRQIVTNLMLIRAAAAERQPHFHFLSGLYDKNALLIEDFARFTVALGIETIGFWPMSKYDYEAARIPLEDRPVPLDELDNAALRPRLECVAAAFSILKNGGININVHGDFVVRLGERVGVDVHY